MGLQRDRITHAFDSARHGTLIIGDGGSVVPTALSRSWW